MTQDALFGEGFEDRTYLLSPVIYILCLDEVVQYVGASLQFDNRIYKHRLEKRFPFNRLYLKPVPKAIMGEEELRLIKLFNPPFNVVGTDKFKRRSREEIKAEATALLIAVGLKKPPELRRRPL